ncbi:MAG TPA: alpha/beta hydrolase-fold protein, partial [Chitinophagaceae bacterium]|nr:alpha/beta hydrolase-fold protein [Chitinophagaceae bacterium]
MEERTIYKKGKITARPGTPTAPSVQGPGTYPLALRKGRDGLLYIPSGWQPEVPAPLAVLLHGAGGLSAHGLAILRKQADKNGIILLAPDSAKGSWDIVYGSGFGHDVLFLNQALEELFSHYSIRPDKIAVGGFSDGASYALSLGLINGDLFTHILAFSPGFMEAPDPAGKPAIYISHGTEDSILPIDPCSRK